MTEDKTADKRTAPYRYGAAPLAVMSGQLLLRRRPSTGNTREENDEVSRTPTLSSSTRFVK